MRKKIKSFIGDIKNYFTNDFTIDNTPRQNLKIDWDNISITKELSEDYIEQYHDKLNWLFICKNQKLSENFIEKHLDKIDWFIICENQKLSENFIEKHQDKVLWFLISQYQTLSEKFILKFHNKVEWYLIFRFQVLSEEFIFKVYFMNDDTTRSEMLEFEFKMIMEYQEKNITPHFLFLLYKNENILHYNKLKEKNNEFREYAKLIEEQIPKVLIEFYYDEENILSTSRISAPRLNYINVGLSLDNIVAQCPTYEMSGITEYIHIRDIDI